MDDFDGGFEEMMSSAIEYEKLKRAGKKIPKRLEERLRRSTDWLKELRELKTGKKAGTWLSGDDFEYEFAECSNCGRMQYAGWNSHAEAETMIGSFHANYRFCPGCGAEMTGGGYVRRRRRRRCAK